MTAVVIDTPARVDSSDPRAMDYFAVTTAHGPNWDPSKPIRAQVAWDAHASFLDGLVDDGFVVLGGPLDDGTTALLVVTATDEAEARHRLAADPWHEMDMLHVATVQRWSIWLDGRDRAVGS